MLALRHQLLLVCALVVGAAAVSNEDTLALDDSAAWANTGLGVDTDGETKAGRYGDYSDWMKKYHIGPHHAYHATPGGMPVKAAKAPKVVQNGKAKAKARAKRAHSSKKKPKKV